MLGFSREMTEQPSLSWHVFSRAMTPPLSHCLVHLFFQEQQYSNIFFVSMVSSNSNTTATLFLLACLSSSKATKQPSLLW